MVEATPPLRKHKDSVWQELHLPKENTRILCGKNYTSLRKTQGVCVARATRPLGKHKESVWQKLRHPEGKHKESVWQEV